MVSSSGAHRLLALSELRCRLAARTEWWLSPEVGPSLMFGDRTCRTYRQS